jgi:hypothetical protein
MWAKAFVLLQSKIFVTFLKAELGFFGVCKKTFKQLPFFCGHF